MYVLVGATGHLEQASAEATWSGKEKYVSHGGVQIRQCGIGTSQGGASRPPTVELDKVTGNSRAALMEGSLTDIYVKEADCYILDF